MNLIRYSSSLDLIAPAERSKFAAFTAEVVDKVLVIGDDLLVTNLANIEIAKIANACNTLLCKPNQVGTLTEAKAAFEAATCCRVEYGCISAFR